MALYRSFPITFLMNAPYATILVSTNESMKTILHKRYNPNIMTYLTAGGLAGGLASLLTIPFDVIKTRLQIQYIYHDYGAIEKRIQRINAQCSEGYILIGGIC